MGNGSVARQFRLGRNIVLCTEPDYACESHTQSLLLEAVSFPIDSGIRIASKAPSLMQTGCVELLNEWCQVFNTCAGNQVSHASISNLALTLTRKSPLSVSTSEAGQGSLFAQDVEGSDKNTSS